MAKQYEKKELWRDLIIGGPTFGEKFLDLFLVSLREAPKRETGEAFKVLIIIYLFFSVVVLLSCVCVCRTGFPFWSGGGEVCACEIYWFSLAGSYDQL
jgi:hypothetical protein